MNSNELKHIQMRKFFVAGAIVVVCSLIISGFPSIVIGMLEAEIKAYETKQQYNPPLTEAEQHILLNVRYTQGWWATIQISVIRPLANIILVIGLFLIAYAFIVRFL